MDVRNKKIVKNTLVVYASLVFKIVVGVILTRLVLDAIGVSDYGLYNVVGGLVAMFTFISNSLAETTTRFLNVEMGRKEGDINKVFNVCNSLHLLLAVLFFLLVESFGVLYINYFLEVEPGKETDAMFVFQVSTIMCCMGIINVPFASLFNVTERFIFSVSVDIIVKVIQLILIATLLYYNGNRLRAFSLIMTTSTLISFAIFHYYSYKYWPETVKWKFVKERALYKEVFKFANYNVLATITALGRNNGGVLLINYFFGTVINGAYAIARTIELQLSNFAYSLLKASSPQITQSYGRGDYERVYALVSRVGKYTMLLMLLAFFPLWSELDYLLIIWLDNVPDGTLEFCYLTLLLYFVGVTDAGLTHVINASGQIASFRIVYCILTLSAIPIGGAMFFAGYPAYMLLVLFLLADTLYRIFMLFMIHSKLKFPVVRFLKDVYWPVIKVTSVLLLIMLVPLDLNNGLLWHFVHFVMVVMLTCSLIFLLGLDCSERSKVVTFVKNKIF